MYLHEDTLIVLVSTPKSFDTVHVTDRLAVGTTLILCVTLPLTKGLSSSWGGGKTVTKREEKVRYSCCSARLAMRQDRVRTTRGRCWIDEQTKRPRGRHKDNKELRWNIDSGVWQESRRHKDKLPTPFSLCCCVCVSSLTLPWKAESLLFVHLRSWLITASFLSFRSERK